LIENVNRIIVKGYLLCDIFLEIFQNLLKGVMVFNATFNNISVISWWSALLVEETGVTVENHRSAANK
jgi:hypothetical protein